MKPFRWDLKKQEQLGKLLDGQRATFFDGFFSELLECAQKIVSINQGASFVFVGRSPESIFDLLTGAYEGRPEQEHLIHLNISNRFQSIRKLQGEMPFQYEALKLHFLDLGLSPDQIVQAPRQVCFVDLVYAGGTYELLFEFLKNWCAEEKSDFSALKRKIKFLGITERTKNSPNTWRWQQHADWVKDNPEIEVKNISISRLLWGYLGDYQEKVENSNHPKKWGDNEMLLPPRGQENFRALRLAYDVYLYGKENASKFC